MLELVRLRADHGPAVHAFERENRAFFARTVSDRGEELFRDFARRYDALLRDQETGTCAYGKDGTTYRLALPLLSR